MTTNPSELENLPPADRPAFPARLIQDVTGQLAQLDIASYTGQTYRAYVAAQALPVCLAEHTPTDAALIAVTAADDLIEALQLDGEEIAERWKSLLRRSKAKAKADGGS